MPEVNKIIDILQNERFFFLAELYVKYKLISDVVK
jgi:hypothetical protein